MLRFPKAKISFQNAMKKTIVLALFLASIAAGVIYIALSGKSVEARPQEPKLPYPYLQ
jgi:membrane associated rhomboid family serine protease